MIERPGPIPAARAAAPPERLGDLDSASRAFASLLTREVIRAMVAGSTESGFFGSETGAGAWEEMFESGLSDFVASGGERGLAEMIYRELEPSVRRAVAAAQAPDAPADTSLEGERLPGRDR